MRFAPFVALFAIALPVARADESRAFLSTHCAGCHSGDSKSGGFDLDRLPQSPADPVGSAMWAKVHDRVASGQMPPAKKPRPPKVATDTFLGSIRTAFAAAESGRDRTTLRRLNRTEYQNTLRDLFDLPGLNVRDLLPDDGRAHGFDKSAASLDISPIQMAKYLEAADVVLDLAIAKTMLPPQSQRVRMHANENYDFGVVIPNGDGVMLKDFQYDDSRFPIPKDAYAGGKYPGLGELERSGVWKERPGTAGLFRCLGESFAGRFSKFAPNFPGRYRITTSVWSFWWDKGAVKESPRTQAAGIYFGSRPLGFFDAPSLKPTGHQIVAWLDADDYLKFDAASLWEVHVYHHKDKAAGYTGPGVAIDYLEVEGPLHDEWPPVSHKRLFDTLPMVPLDKLPAGAKKPPRAVPRRIKTPDSPNPVGAYTFATVHPDDPAAAAESLLRKFLPKLFRRPVAKTELYRYVRIVADRLISADPFETAMRSAYKAALCSPEFLFLRESAPESGVVNGPLDDWSLAARLSYFLYNSMPDDELFASASAGELRKPEVLRAQVERMLKDPKSERFIADFLDQWLDLRDLDATSPDKKLYPEYTPYLRHAIAGEPAQFFRKLLADDRPVASLVASDFLMLNQRLAEHYGIAGVNGTTFRGVPVPPDRHRGGFLTQAAVLKVTANGTTTSPVKRGAWVMKKLLGQPPEPPPPDIAAVEPDVKGAVTIREQLAKHRSNVSCAGCHARIDPPGFALESFDVIGGARDRYRATEGKERADLTALFPSHRNPAGRWHEIYHVGFTLGQPVDAKGETADGKPFDGIDGFRAILAAEPRLLARNFVNQLLTYGTGTPMRFTDRQAVDAILDRSGDLRMRRLIHELIQSPLFRTK
jgi:mono/diheme cytochrome c family protein